jgi:hypothetical protein
MTPHFGRSSDLPKFRDLKRYCERNGWQMFKQTDHFWYRKLLSDGSILITKVSLSLGKEIPRGLWKHILSKQLRITPEEFNNSK